MTIIRYALPKSVRVKLTIFNSLGETIDTLVDETQAAGRYEIRWQPVELTSGVYFYRIQTADFSETRAMLFLR